MILRNPNLKKEIVEELEWLNEHYFQFDKPIPYKNGLTIYPILASQYDEFLKVSDCLILNKNDSSDGITLTHLGYLFSKMEDQVMGKYWAAKFTHLLEMVFHKINGIKCTSCNNIMTFVEFGKLFEEKGVDCVCPYCQAQQFEEVIRYKENEQGQQELLIDGAVINSKDFESFRQIIMYQNFPEYQDDSWVDSAVRQDQAKRQEILAKQESSGSATLEEKLVAVSALTSYKLEDVYNLSMRKFIIMLHMVDDIMRWQADRTGIMSGMVTLKKPLEHWLYKPKKSMYETATSVDSYKDQISKGNNS